VDPNKTKGRIEEAEEKLNSNPHARDLVRTAVSRSLSRRSFLGRVSTSSVAAVAGVGASALLLSEKAKADGATTRRRTHHAERAPIDFVYEQLRPSAMSRRPIKSTMATSAVITTSLATTLRGFRTTVSGKLTPARTRRC
jgi:hypothetical protein